MRRKPEEESRGTGFTGSKECHSAKAQYLDHPRVSVVALPSRSPFISLLMMAFILQGVGCLFIPKIGLLLFIVFYTFGNVCSLLR